MPISIRPVAWRWVQYGALVAAALWLTGCASYLSARVTQFQQWPPDAAGHTYQIVQAAQPHNALEFQAYADMVAAAMGPTHLVRAGRQGGGAARFDVELTYGDSATTVMERQYPSQWDGWAMSPFFGGYYGWGGFGWGGWYTPSAIDVPVTYHQNTLTVAVRDRHQEGREVYRATAVLRTDEPGQLAHVMPYLAQAIFEDFPGGNGQVRTVRYELPR